MNNTMTISDGIKKNTVKDYENKLFKKIIQFFYSIWDKKNPFKGFD